jgi:imidazole glycerol-phosphate synthase subunit HisF
MLTKRIIPCLDVKDGRVVKGVSFVNLRDAGDPVEAAVVYDREGADELCFLDITASHENRRTIIDVVERTAAQGLHAGHGRRRGGNARRYPNLLNAGADKVSINTAAVQTPGVRAKRPLSDSARNASSWRSMPNAQRPVEWEVFTHGGRTATGVLMLVEWAEADGTGYGAGEILAHQHGSGWPADGL